MIGSAPVATPSMPSSRPLNLASSRAAKARRLFAFETMSLRWPSNRPGLGCDRTWYWDMNDNNSAWTKRWQAERPGKLPTSPRGRLFLGHPLSEGGGGLEGRRRWPGGRCEMKEMPTSRLYGKGTVRVDGRKIHDAYLFQVRRPRIQVPRRPLQVARHPGRGSVPSALKAAARWSAAERFVIMPWSLEVTLLPARE